MYIVNAATIQALDQRTIQELGLPALVLMERAALGAVAAIYQALPNHLQSVQILVGTGNNGGDGLAIGRLLHNQGVPVKLWLHGDHSRRSPDNLTQLQICQRLGIPAEAVCFESFAQELKSASLIIDTLFGVGLNRELTGDWARIIELANASDAKKLALDLPSGLQSDTGQVLGTAFVADLTVSCALPKWAHLLDQALAYVGQLEIADIGIPPLYCAELKEQVLTRQLAQQLKPGPRAKNSHKGTYGSLGLIAGSLGMSGAARMAAEAALQTGVGLVFLFVPASIQEQLAAAQPEVQVIPLPEAAGQLAPQAAELLSQHLSELDALLIGPGLGRGQSVAELLQLLLPELKQPLVLDADALWHLAQDPELLQGLQPPLILTPHPGELARLLQRSAREIQADRVTAARQMAERFQATALLKGARSLIAEPDGRLWFNSTGNPGMARGGMGDVLAGLIGGLLAQGLSSVQASCLGCYWHGLAGDRLAQNLPETALTVQRLLAILPEAWARI